MSVEPPYEAEAEATVVPCAIATPRGCELAKSRLKPSDFWNPKYRALLEAALSLEVTDQEDRKAAVASATGVSVSEITAMLNDRAVMWDKSGSFARRVLDASRRRRAMTAAARIYNGLGSGARLDEIAADLQELLAVAS